MAASRNRGHTKENGIEFEYEILALDSAFAILLANGSLERWYGRS